MYQVFSSIYNFTFLKFKKNETMSKILQVIAVVSFILLPFFCCAQDNSLEIIQIRGNIYQVENQLLHFNNMGYLFENSKEDLYEFKKSSYRFKTAKALGYTSLVSIPVGLVLLSINTRSGFFTSKGSSGPSDIIGFTLLALIAPISGITGLINQSKAIKDRDKLIDSYNAKTTQNIGLKLIPATQGVGLGLRFTF